MKKNPVAVWDYKTGANFINKSLKLKFKGTVGVGDFMHGLNVAYCRSYYMGAPVTLDFHWYHDEDYLYHFEDPETIIERFEYIHNFYNKTDVEVKVNHIFNSDNMSLYANRFEGYSRIRKGGKRDSLKWNDWMFRKLPVATQPGKIVMWNPLSNAEEPRPFKRTFDREDWNKVISIIEMQGYTVTEIDYRTPISEVMYHIATCECTLSYEGMWHYVAKNMMKPMIVLTKDNITKYHTPHALIYKVRKVETHSFTYFYEFDRRVRRAKQFNNVRTDDLRKLYIED